MLNAYSFWAVEIPKSIKHSNDSGRNMANIIAVITSVKTVSKINNTALVLEDNKYKSTTEKQ